MSPEENRKKNWSFADESYSLSTFSVDQLEDEYDTMWHLKISNSSVHHSALKKCQHNHLGRLNINTIRNIYSADLQITVNSSIARLISLPTPCQTRSIIRVPSLSAKVNKSSVNWNNIWTYGTNNRFTFIFEGAELLVKVKDTCMLGLAVVVVVKYASELITMAFVNWSPS